MKAKALFQFYLLDGKKGELGMVLEYFSKSRQAGHGHLHGLQCIFDRDPSIVRESASRFAQDDILGEARVEAVAVC